MENRQLGIFNFRMNLREFCEIRKTSYTVEECIDFQRQIRYLILMIENKLNFFIK